MIRPTPRRPRSGLTLTEVLIGIMIMGIGMVSLATLFPLGLVRVRDATRYTRSTLLGETAMGEIEGRDLLGRLSFIFTWYPNADPWVQDTPFVPGSDPTTGGVYRGRGSYPVPSGTFPVPPVPGNGLPVMYDPLFWAVNHQTAGINPYTASLAPLNAQARFGQGLGFVRPDPGDGGTPSAHGLQRITNFAPLGIPIPGQPGGASVAWPFLYTVPAGGPADLVGTVFASGDDIVFQTAGVKGAAATGGVGSPLVPDLTLTPPVPSIQTDWAFSWAFTGQRTNVSDYTVYDGSIVIFHNRAFALETIPAAFGGAGAQVASGERVVEAVWGWSPTVDSVNYGNGDDRTVVLRWPATQPDPTIAVGGWIADVTYERSFSLDLSRYRTPAFPGNPNEHLYPGQRCYWYQVSKRTAPEFDALGFAGDPVPYRRMIVTLNSPVRAKTRLMPDGKGSPFHVNVALIAPNVVNVFTKVFYSR